MPNNNMMNMPINDYLMFMQMMMNLQMSNNLPLNNQNNNIGNQ